MLKMSKKWIISLLMLLIAFQMKGISSQPVAIIGGEFISKENPYPVAYLIASDHSTQTLSHSGPQKLGSIRSVAINSSGNAIIGGMDHNAIGTTSNQPYMGLVSPNGEITALGGPFLPRGWGIIGSVAINDSGNAVIGGLEEENNAYIALVSPDGSTKGLGDANPLGSGGVYSVAINDSGNALVGGEDQNYSTGYLALITPDGLTKQLSGSPIPEFIAITSVAINDLGNGAITGSSIAGSPYIAFVSSDGVVKDLSSILPKYAKIYSVAIDSEGNALIVGENLLRPYVALVAPDGKTTEFDTQFEEGAIYSVSMTPFGMAIIGGTQNIKNVKQPYAGIIYPHSSGYISKVNLASSEGGGIYSVAINSEGTRQIIGGQVNGSLYAAFVNLDSSCELLNNSSMYTTKGVIHSVSIRGGE